MGVAARVAGWDRRMPRTLAGPLSPPLGTLSDVTFPTTLLIPRVQIALGADVTADPVTWLWEDITGYVRAAPGIGITQWRGDESATTTPSRATLVLDNSDGRFSRRNPTGTYYGLLGKNTPIWISVDPGDGQHTRFEGFVNAWPNRWDITGTDSVVTIECAGALRRLSQGSRTMSAIRRSILATNPETYWPLEDGSDATAPAAVRGVAMSAAGSVAFAGVSDLVGSLPVVDIHLASVYGQVSGVSSSSWHVEFLHKQTGFDAAGSVIARLYVGSASHSIFRFFPPTAAGDGPDVFITRLDDGTVTTALVGTNVTAGYAGLWHHYAVTAEQSGSNIVCKFYVDGVLNYTDTTAGTLGAPNAFIGNPQKLTTLTSIAHVAVGSGTTLSGAADGIDGFSGELAHIRLRRLCTEAGVPFYSTAGISVAMGPQPAGTLVTCAREAEAADHGTLYERNWGLAYAGREERENRPAVIALDFDSRDIAAPPEPTDDDQRTRNIWTSTNSLGGEATFEQTTGSMGTGSAGPGDYDDSAPVNVATDQLRFQASYQVNLGTVDEDRWPRVAVDLRNSPDLIDEITTMVPGVRATATHPPGQMAPDTVDTIIEGYGEWFDQFVWGVELVTSPASPYHVFKLSETAGDLDPVVGILDFDTCVLAEDLDTTETGVDVTTTGALFSTTADNWTPGVVITVLGEDMLLTAVSGSSNPQTLTVTRSYNGVVKSHASGAAVAFKSPGVLGL